VVTGSSAIVTNSGTNTAAVLNFTIPKGDKGDVGPAGSVNAANGIAFTHQATPADPGSSKTILYSKADGLPYYLPTGNVERRILNETDLYTAVITEATTTRTLLLTDANKGIVTTNASAVTITIPPNSTTPIPIGSKAEVFQRGTGVLTVIGAATVVVNGVTTGSVNAAAQFSSLILWKIGTDEWLVEVDSGNQEYSELLNIPSTFTPAAHTQAISTITDLQTALDVKAPLTPAQDTITYAATVDLNMTTLNGQLRTISLTGNLTLTVSNQASQRSVILRLVSDATLRTLTFPADWKFLGTKPANIAASKVGVLSLTFFGSTDADCVAAWGVQS
jgi:hypothetical protein